MRKRVGAGAAWMALTLMGSVAIGSAALVAGSGEARADGSSAIAAAAASAQTGAYCVRKGGVVETRQPYFNTNADAKNWLRLDGTADFCKFASASDGSRIRVLLSTLFMRQPTLAALAYYAKVPLNQKACPGTASPGSCYCSQLGGTDAWGGFYSANGGWVRKSDPVDTVLDACVFPDMSSIDTLGLFYHRINVINGVDLQGILRFPDPYK